MRLLKIIVFSLLMLLIGGVALAQDMQNERFRMVDDSIVIDANTGLMWSIKDNGSDIDWYGASKFCADFSAGEYTDWRIPTLKELETLYTEGISNKDGYFIADPFQITECCMWSSYDTMGGRLVFSFKSGKKPAAYLTDSYQLRVLPVRGDIKKEYASNN